MKKFPNTSRVAIDTVDLFNDKIKDLTLCYDSVITSFTRNCLQLYDENQLHVVVAQEARPASVGPGDWQLIDCLYYTLLYTNDYGKYEIWFNTHECSPTDAADVHRRLIKVLSVREALSKEIGRLRTLRLQRWMNEG